MKEVQSTDELTALPTETRFWPSQKYLEYWRQSIQDIEAFWGGVARGLVWHQLSGQVLDWKPPFARWYVGGMINACYNAVDRHMTTWRKNKAAYIWEGELGDRRAITYADLFREVNRFAAGLTNLGIKKQDRIALYMPMIPEFPIAMLAASRIGAIFTVVFSGFSATALANRIQDSESRLVVTADGGYRRGKTLPLKEIVDEAVRASPSVEHVVVYRRIGREVPMTSGRDIWWHDLTNDVPNYVAPEPFEADHPLYILYTSGTTGKPKGAVHSTGGYLTYVYATQKWVFDVNDEDIYWCTADIGWVTGHSYVVFGPLMHGVTSVMYEGALDYPAADRWWQIVERYGVTILYTTPTAVRTLMKYGDDFPRRHDLSTLRLLGTVGEPINPAAWEWYYRIIGRERCPIVDTWWQTETGGILISPAPNIALVPLKPGSATYCLPGIDADVVNESGASTAPGEKGYLVIRKPWPGMFMTLYKDPDRYRQVYWERFPGVYYTGDYAVRDKDGYFWLLGRADEVLKVAGHRLGTIEIEDALVGHAAVAEAAVTGRPHEVKGEAIVAFVTLRHGYNPSDTLVQELLEHVRKELGPIATPEEIHFVSSLPKTRSGKIMRRVVKAVASKRDIGDTTTLEDEASVEEVRQAFAEFKQA